MIYDCIVLGVGGIGSAALYSAARRGWKVLGVDRYGTAHDQGSSHGRTRIIRTAYFEHPNYVPLARKAWEQWHELQKRSNLKLIQKTGLLQVGDPEGAVIQGVLRSAAEHEIQIDRLTPADTMQRFPAFDIPENAECVFEETAGFLLVENCISQTIKSAKDLGAQFLANTLIENLTLDSGGLISIRSNNGDFQARRLIVCAGAWTPELLGGLPFSIEVVRKQQQWFQLDRVDIKYENGFPCYLFENESGCFYGFPEIDYLGMKVAEHGGGTVVDRPQLINRDVDPMELARTETFMDRTLNFTRRRLVHHSVCMYSKSVDGHLIVDQHPETSQIVFAAGLSGHGFKFAPLLGERLVGLLENEPDEMLDFLKIGDRNLVATS